jgi:hypothetical protein
MVIGDSDGDEEAAFEKGLYSAPPYPSYHRRRRRYVKGQSLSRLSTPDVD